MSEFKPRKNPAAALKKPIILASGSPRRKELLTQAGVPFEVIVSNVDESERRGESARQMVLRLAKAKAAHVAQANPGRIVLAADTTVAQDGKVLGKPENAKAAHAMLRRLSGKTHEVLTAFCVMHADGRATSAVVKTVVSFRQLNEQDIARYVATNEPMDKAGAYGIQGLGAACVDTVRGSYTNVVGLPVKEVLAALSKTSAPKQRTK